MGSFTKKYIRSFHPEDSLYLSWDIGYKNVAVYDGKRLVKQFEKAGQFTKGVTFQDEKLGKIRLEFTTTKPLQLELKVNGKKYKPTKKGKQDVDLSGLVAFFWVLMALNGIALLINLAVAINLNALQWYLPQIGFLFVVMVIFFTTAFLMSRKKHWAFYIGFSYFALSSAYYAFIVAQFDVSTLEGIKVFVRVLMFSYLLLNLRKVTYVIQNSSDKKDESVIDDII